MTLMRGRSFNDADRLGSPQVMIVSESMAAGFWPGENPLGRCVLFGELETDPQCTQVIGVASDTHRQSVIEDEQWLYYIPIAQRIVDQRPEGIFIHTGTDPDRAVATLRTQLLAVPGVSYVSVRSYQSVIDPELRAWRLGATMFTVFGFLALLVAGVGLYSVLSFNVAQRFHEMGIRTALGASRRSLVGMVVREAIGLTTLGVVIGLAVAAGLSAFVEPILYGVSPRDSMVFLSVATGLMAAGVCAGLLPARRASRANAMEVLRAD